MQHDELENISKSAIDAFISRMERGIVDDDDPLVDESDSIDKIFDSWKLEDALGGRAAVNPRERLRVDRTDGERPFTKRTNNPTCSVQLSTGEPGTRRKCGNWTLEFGADGTVAKAWSDETSESAFNLEGR